MTQHKNCQTYLIHEFRTSYATKFSNMRAMEILMENRQNPNTSKPYSEKNDISTNLLFTEITVL